MITVEGLTRTYDAGTSTTLRMIVGMPAPTAGRATVGGMAHRELRQPLRTAGALSEPRSRAPRPGPWQKRTAGPAPRGDGPAATGVRAGGRSRPGGPSGPG